jgi:hypothetical protein
MGKNNKFILHISLLYVCILGGIFLLGYQINASSSATATLTVTNATPTASNIALANVSGGNINLTSATTTLATATFTITDNNGCEDIDSTATKTSAVFYRTDVDGGVSCTPDAANCYTFNCTQDAASCTSGGEDLNATYTCTGTLQFYADPTDAGSPHADTTWTVGIIPADSSGAASASTSYTAEMVSLTSLSVTAEINYSSLALGADTGSTDQTTTVTNTGNRVIDTQVGGYGSASDDGYSMVCTIGNTPVANEKYSLSASTAYASKTALVTDTSPNTATTNIAQGASSTGDIYWGMGLPETGVGGTCTGHVVFTAVNH